MNKLVRSHKTIFLFATLFVLAGLLFTLFHHHSDGDHSLDCPVCRLVQHIASLLIVSLVILMGAVLQPIRFFISSSEKFVSLLLASDLQSRAPPSLS